MLTYCIREQCTLRKDNTCTNKPKRIKACFANHVLDLFCFFDTISRNIHLNGHLVEIRGIGMRDAGYEYAIHTRLHGRRVVYVTTENGEHII